MAKILIHTLMFAPDGVSTAYLYADIAKQLKLHGHEVTVLTTTPHFNKVQEHLKEQPLKKKIGGLYYKSFYDKTIEVYHIPLKKSKNSLIRIISFIKFHLFSLCIGVALPDFQIILSPSPPLTIGIISWIISLFKNAKTIYNVQEIYPDFAIKQGIIKNKLVISLLKYIEKTVYNKSDAIVTIDENFSEIIRSRIKNKTKITTIPNFVDTDLYFPLPRINSFSSEHNLEEKFVVIYAGNIGYAQEWDPILYAANNLKDESIVFLIIGDGVKKNWLKEKIEQGSIKNILLLPYQSRDKMPIINASADVHTIVMAKSSSSEGFPSKIYTTMACGRTSIVVTDKNSPLALLMKKAEFGKVIDCGNKEAYVQAILEAYHNRAILNEDGQRAREFIVTKFSKEIITNKYNSLINKLINAS